MKHLTKEKLVVLITIIWFIASVLVWLLNPGARKGPFGFGSPAPMTIFQAEDRSFSIKYPKNWVPFDLPDGSRGDKEVIASILVSGRQLADVDVARRNFPNGNINNVVDWGQLRASQRADYFPEPLFLQTNFRLKGFFQDYTWLHSDKVTRMHCQNVYMLAGNIGYSITFCSQERDWAFLKNYYVKMRQSFSVKGGSQ